MPWAGFELQTLGAASSVEDHYTIPLPTSYILLLENFCLISRIISLIFYLNKNNFFVLYSVKSEHMNDGQWMHGHEPDTFRFGFNNMDHPNFAGSPENYTAPPPIEGHAANFDYQMRPDLPPPLGRVLCDKTKKDIYDYSKVFYLDIFIKFHFSTTQFSTININFYNISLQYLTNGGVQRWWLP